MSRPDVAVVGGGIIGLSIAWRLLQRGLTVEVFTSEPGAWFVAAGMLAAGGESTFERPALARLMADSAQRWPAFAAELGQSSARSGVGSVQSAARSGVLEGRSQGGHGLGFDTAGTFSVALTDDDLAEAAREWGYRGVTGLRPGEVRDREPALSPRIRGGAYLAEDLQVDPRRVVGALRALVPVNHQQVTDLSEVDAETVVVAAGCGTAALTGLPVRPVKGELLRLRGEPGLIRHVINGVADGRHVYLVPRADGEVVVGATQDERTDDAATAGGVLELLRAAIDLVPGLAAFTLAEVLVGHRPATPDNAPLLGALDDRVVLAAGHHRNGILLAPVTADLIADLVATGKADPMLDEFRPGRFSCI